MSVPAPTVRAVELTLRYSRKPALDHVSFTLGDGVTGLLGPNGAARPPCCGYSPPPSRPTPVS